MTESLGVIFNQRAQPASRVFPVQMIRKRITQARSAQSFVKIFAADSEYARALVLLPPVAANCSEMYAASISAKLRGFSRCCCAVTAALNPGRKILFLDPASRGDDYRSFNNVREFACIARIFVRLSIASAGCETCSTFRACFTAYCFRKYWINFKDPACAHATAAREC